MINRFRFFAGGCVLLNIIFAFAAAPALRWGGKEFRMSCVEEWRQKFVRDPISGDRRGWASKGAHWGGV